MHSILERSPGRRGLLKKCVLYAKLNWVMIKRTFGGPTHGHSQRTPADETAEHLRPSSAGDLLRPSVQRVGRAAQLLGNQISHYKERIEKNQHWTYMEGYIDEGLSAATTKRWSGTVVYRPTEREK